MAYDATNRRVYVDRTDPNNTIGIELGEIRRALGAGAGEELSRHANINPWAKFKPLPVGDMSGYTDAQAKAINYGLYVPYYTTLRDMLYDVRRGVWSGAANYDSAKTPCQYVGLASEDWSRVLDFDGYRGFAPQPVTAIAALRNIVGLGQTPEFYTNLAEYLAEYLVLSDIGVSVGGTEYRGTNMYVGLAVCDGQNATTIYAEHNFWEVLQSTATQLNDRTQRRVYFSDDFAFDRNSISPYNAPACLFLSSVNNPTINSTGVFIPVIPTRSVINLEFLAPSILPISRDSVTAWWADGNGDATVIVKCLPNGDFKAKLQLVYEKINGDTWMQSSESSRPTVNLYDVWAVTDVTDPDTGETIYEVEAQFPNFIKISTGTDSVGTRIITAQVYVAHPDTTFDDIYVGADYTGTPISPRSTDTAPITSGTILNGEDPLVANISAISLRYSLGNDNYGYTQQSSYQIL